MYGTPGNGKTHAAIGLGRELHDAGVEVHYRYMPDCDGTRSFFGRRTSLKIGDQPDSVFPQGYAPGTRRNPRSALILDDYTPESQPLASRAIDAAAQFGGLVIMTSNHPDPFRLFEAPGQAQTPEQIVVKDLAQRVDPEAAARIDQAGQQRRAEINEGLRSRIAHGFRFIQFTGSDYRATNSFWDS